ncbi:MAG TPA: YbaK/EbsC family protein [Jiangellaceae bacterium]
METFGTLDPVPAAHRLDLLAEPVARALTANPSAATLVAEIDPDLADTAALCDAYDVPLDVSANCVVVSGKRGGEQRIAACLILATTRADINNVVRKRLDVRKASFLPTADAVELTGMEFGGITPIGLPSEWPILVDAAVAELPYAVIGSGLRKSKLLVPGKVLAAWPGAEVVDGLAR